MWMRRTISLAVSCAVACGGGGEAITHPPTKELVVVAGGAMTDTARAHPVQALVVEVRVDGEPRAGMAVTFSGTLLAEPNPAQRLSVWTSDAANDVFTSNTQQTTNAMGRALVRLALGERAGPAAVVVKCPALDLTDTVRYTVLPGNAYRLAFTKDTAVLAGVTYPVDASVRDWNGNRRDDAVTYAAGPNAVAVDGSGRVTVPNEVVRGAVAVRSGSLLDSARFTVVPDGEIAYLDFTDVGTSAADGVITTSRMDGTRKRTWGKARTPAFPKLSPTDSLVAYSRVDDLGSWSVFFVDQKGAALQAYPATGISSARHPRFTADGKYFYLSGSLSAPPVSIWRLRTDGSEPPLRVLATPDAYGEPLFDVTRDGRYIAFADGPGAVIHDLTTGQERALGTYASALEFSPDGKRLAYIDLTGLTIVNVDGGAPLKVDGPLSAGVLTWTADGKWLLTRDGTGVILLNATSGQRVSVPFGERYQLSTRR
jgi:hypothetical protein